MPHWVNPLPRRQGVAGHETHILQSDHRGYSRCDAPRRQHHRRYRGRSRRIRQARCLRLRAGHGLRDGAGPRAHHLAGRRQDQDRRETVGEAAHHRQGPRHGLRRCLGGRLRAVRRGHRQGRGGRGPSRRCHRRHRGQVAGPARPPRHQGLPGSAGGQGRGRLRGRRVQRGGHGGGQGREERRRRRRRAGRHLGGHRVPRRGDRDAPHVHQRDRRQRLLHRRLALLGRLLGHRRLRHRRPLRRRRQRDEQPQRHLPRLLVPGQRLRLREHRHRRHPASAR